MQTQTIFDNGPLRSQKNEIQAESFHPDFENLGARAFYESDRIVKEGILGIWYINQIANVSSHEDSDEFLRLVLKRQAEWFRLLTREFKNDWRRRIDLEKMGCMQQGFEYDGVIVLKNTIFPFQAWNRERKTNPIMCGYSSKE